MQRITDISGKIFWYFLVLKWALKELKNFFQKNILDDASKINSKGNVEDSSN